MNVQLKYAGAALPGNAETVIFFDTAISVDGVNLTTAALRAAARGYAMAKGHCAQYGLKRFILRLVNDQAGTLNIYRSSDRGVTWTKIYTAAVAASAANSENVYDVLVEGLPDFKVEWVNGAVAQTTWFPSMELTDERGVAA